MIPHEDINIRGVLELQSLFRLLICMSLVIALTSAPAFADETPKPPQALFEDLYADVELQRVFPDSKAFADATPRASPAEILARYHAHKPLTPEALRAFVTSNFSMPESEAPPVAASAIIPLRAHIDSLWDELTRSTPTAPPYSSLLPLPKPYVVPGGRFRELYYWDSYFTMLGLAESGRGDLLADMVEDFAYFIQKFGHAPNGARSYYLSRSQPPVFFAMVGLLSPADPAAAYAGYLPRLKQEYAFWMEGAEGLAAGQAHRRVVAFDGGDVLNRYFDDSDAPRDESYREDVATAQASPREPQQTYRQIRAAAESGWDFSSRWFADGHALASLDTTDIIPVDLNSWLFGLEGAIRAGCDRLADAGCVDEFSGRMARRRAAIDRYLWAPTHGVYFDYRWTSSQAVDNLSAATLYPLFLQLASDKQAASVARATERELLKPGGIMTTTVNTGQQWDAPNGWAPLQWIAIDGLARYGQRTLAQTIACRWIVNVSNHYRRSGKLVEKYDVLSPDNTSGGGEYPTQDGFGWTNGVTRKLMGLYPDFEELTSLDECPHPSASGG